MPSMDKSFEFTEAFDIQGIHTEFVVQKFTNRTLIIVTQFNKIGNFYSAKSQIVNDASPLSRNTEVFDIQQKFGPPSIEIEGAIRYLLNHISSSQELLICLALKNHEEIEKEQLDEIKDVLITIPCLVK